MPLNPDAFRKEIAAQWRTKLAATLSQQEFGQLETRVVGGQVVFTGPPELVKKAQEILGLSVEDKKEDGKN